jgi:hypothetical protein
MKQGNDTSTPSITPYRTLPLQYTHTHHILTITQHLPLPPNHPPNSNNHAPHLPHAHTLPHPHAPPNNPLPLLPRRPNRPLPRIHIQHKHALALRHTPPDILAPRLLALHHIHHPLTIQSRQTSLLRALETLHPGRPSLFRGSTQCSC